MTLRLLSLIAVAALCLTSATVHPAAAQTKAPPASPPPSQVVEKLNAYVGCINRLSERSYESRNRYFSWAAKSGPTGKERIIYGTYTIYDTSDCKKNVEKANTLEPRDADLEAAASAYAAAVTTLEPLLKEADDYYTQENYKDDKMAKGKAMHPKLVAAWDAFGAADKKLRAGIEAINDKRAQERLAEIESKEGRKVNYHVAALMIHAKRVLRAETSDKPDIAAITQAVGEYEASVKAIEEASGKDGDVKLGSFFTGNAKSYLTTAKQLMRRIRDKTPYSSGDRMMLNSGGRGWMVEGSPPRLLRDYNQLIDSFNRGVKI
ncbi:MAG: YiiG family protein [Proteobacteria bacterium]|nr:YiiG family protein [Pseudomonadota bacterium]